MDKAAIARTIALVVVLVNTVLALFGIPFVVPVEVADQVAAVTIVLMGLYTAVKNDFFKKKK